ncbi:hypothetical protein KAV79_02185 [Candidatus Aerophobetes bacterium]|nr:hypothetical protein [Candidatus Aerophobetes bacterium]
MATEDEEKQRKVLDEITKELSQISLDSTPPEMGEKIFKQDFAIFNYIQFKKVLDSTEEILYIADNSAEVISSGSDGPGTFLLSAKDVVRMTGQMGVPVLLIGRAKIVGFDKAKIDRLLGL